MVFSPHGVSLCVLWFFCLRAVYFSGTSFVGSFEKSVAVGTTKSGTLRIILPAGSFSDNIASMNLDFKPCED